MLYLLKLKLRLFGCAHKVVAPHVAIIFLNAAVIATIIEAIVATIAIVGATIAAIFNTTEVFNQPSLHAVQAWPSARGLATLR